MKKIFYLFLLAFIAISCNETKTVTVTVTNPTALERTGEMAEILMNDVFDKLMLRKGEAFIMTDNAGKQIPYQMTHDKKVIFPVSVAAGSAVTYTLQPGMPEAPKAVVFGRQYPERLDDVAWENDLVAFRTYGPALQAKGEKAFGYDIWTKYNTTELVVEARYAMELHPETLAKIDELKKKDPKAAAKLRAETSYHVDHGNGLDCYKVGPTLGGGVAALMPNGEIVYPYCYKTYRILDNGPLRFTVQLTYLPMAVKGDTNVIETRVISLDAGSYLNKTLVSFEGLNEVTPIATGIVLHEPDGEITSDAANGYITYVDPTDNVNNDNGKIFVGAAFPAPVKEAKPVLFSKKEKKERGDADGHVLAVSDYQPGSVYTYYWGSAWSKAAIKDAKAWNQYMKEFAQKVRSPLKVEVK